MFKDPLNKVYQSSSRDSQYLENLINIKCYYLGYSKFYVTSYIPFIHGKNIYKMGSRDFQSMNYSITYWPLAF